jgi:hypothetical protein
VTEALFAISASAIAVGGSAIGFHVALRFAGKVAQERLLESSMETAKVRARLERYRELAYYLHRALKDVEFSDGGVCPQCGSRSHHPECILGNALKKAEGKL